MRNRTLVFASLASSALRGIFGTRKHFFHTARLGCLVGFMLHGIECATYRTHQLGTVAAVNMCGRKFFKSANN